MNGRLPQKYLKEISKNGRNGAGKGVSHLEMAGDEVGPTSGRPIRERRKKPFFGHKSSSEEEEESSDDDDGSSSSDDPVKKPAIRKSGGTARKKETRERSKSSSTLKRNGKISVDDNCPKSIQECTLMVNVDDVRKRKNGSEANASTADGDGKRKEPAGMHIL